MNGTKTAAALLMVVMLPVSGCLGLFGDDSGSQQDANATSISQSVDEETAETIESRSAEQFQNYTIPGQEALEGTVAWFNGTLGTAEAAAAWEDRNDRSGTNYNTEIIANDISSVLPNGQPAEVKVKLWYFPGPGKSGQIDIYADVPGTETEYNPSDCDSFSWKICTQTIVLNTAGVSGETTEIGVQKSNGRAFQSSLPYQLKVSVTYEDDVITPAQPYAFQVPENATGIVVNSEKAGGGEHVTTQFLVVGPDDNLVQHVKYNDIAIPSESKLIPVDKSGEYILYPIEMTGGFLSVEANTPVPDGQRSARTLELKTETVVDAQAPAPGTGETCAPAPFGGCAQNTTWNGGGSSAFSIDGAFPLEITTFINQGGPNANIDAEIQVQSSNGLVHRSKKIVQYEDERGTIGMSRDELTTISNQENLAKGEYTVRYVIDGTGSVGHTVKTYQR